MRTYTILLLVLAAFLSPNTNAQSAHEKDSIQIARLNAKLNDWPNLARFREENLKLGSPEPGEKRVVFMGNSITAGWAKYWEDHFKGKPYVNRGIGGQTTPQMLLRFRQDVIDLRPSVVVLLCGTNDIAGNTGPSTIEMIESNIIGMAELATANNIRVVLCSVLPVWDYPWKPGLEPAKKIMILNEWMKYYAGKAGYTYVDYHTPMANERKGMKKELANDGVHPTREGYDIMAPLVEKGIADALKSKK